MNRSLIVALFLVLVNISLCSQPVIAILGNNDPDDTYFPEKTKVYASYVRWFEAAGAVSIVIHPWTSEQDIEDLFSKVNGFFFQGGGRDLDLNAPFEKLARKILLRVLNMNLAGNFMPLWGTCQGFELIHSLFANDTKVLTSLEAHNIATPLDFDDSIKTSRMFKYFSDDDFTNLKTLNVTAQFHFFGVSPDAYKIYPQLDLWFRITSYGKTVDNKTYVATIEGKTLPIYAVQFHPEKLPYDRNPSDAIPQFGHAIKISQNLGLFFIEEARKNKNVFTEQDKLRYNFIDSYKQKATLVNGIYYYFYDKQGSFQNDLANLIL